MTDHLPKKTSGDVLHAIVEAISSVVPGASQVLNLLLSPPQAKRRDALLNEVCERLLALETAGFLSVQDLPSNAEFARTIIQALRAAIQDDQQEKLDAFRNAVVNTALGHTPDDGKREMFLAFVDDFTVWHIRILRALLDADSDTTKRHRIETSVNAIADKAVSLLRQLGEQRAVAEVAIKDLCQRNLLFWNPDGGVIYISQGTTQVSDFGREFLTFITEHE